jgi:predicted small lipoprotein YifL
MLTVPALPLQKWSYAVFYAFIMVAAVFYAGSNLTMVSAYPYSIGWSEGNRLWDYSVRFGSDRYLVPEGEEIFALISPGRELLMGLPFLLPNIGIFGVRLWVSLVQIVMPITLGSLLIVGNKKLKEVWKDVVLFAAWTFVFLHQGPIQARLIVSAIIMLLGVRSKNLLVAITLVMLAGYYANISRWTWTYAPGLWAGMIALLRENKPSLRREDWGKLKRPISLGLAGYFGGQILTALIPLANNTQINSGEISLFVSAANQTAFSQALLWYRLLPNPTFSPGILLALLYVIAPLALWMFLARKYGGWRLTRLQILGVSVPMAGFLVIGLVASTKIGGGGDLHNADMFLVGMLVLAANIWPYILSFIRKISIPPVAVIGAYAVMIMPVFYGIGRDGPLVLPPEERVASSMFVIQEEVAIANEQGEVLFMDQRQLLTFGNIQGVTLVADYEKKVLIDRAMAGWQGYFDEFYTDLENHRFALIVTEPIFLGAGDADKPFAEENDVWVKWVSIHLLKHYRVLKNFKAVGIQLLVPRER